MGFFKLKTSKDCSPAQPKLSQSHSNHGGKPASASSDDLSRASTLTEPKPSSGTAECSTALQKAQEDERRRERQERAWREAERRRRGAPAETWQGGLGPSGRST